MSHTYVLMEVSANTYTEILTKLQAAQYNQCLNDEGEIDMHGIALILEEK